MTNLDALKRAIEFWRSNGLNLYAAFPFDEASDLLAQTLAATTPLEFHPKRVILLGNAGGLFWQSLQASTIESDHPVDGHAVRLVTQAIEQFLPQSHARLLFPITGQVPLQQLGKRAGWHSSSPMGVGINAKYGLWYAYRAVLISDADWPLQTQVDNHSPCSSCIAKACIASCPANVLSTTEAIKLTRCIDYRLKPASSCANTCLARCACPEGKSFRYTDEQINYHYGRSLPMLKRWRNVSTCLVPANR